MTEEPAPLVQDRPMQRSVLADDAFAWTIRHRSPDAHRVRLGHTGWVDLPMMRLPALLTSLRRRPRGPIVVGAALLAGASLLAIGTARRRARAATADPETGLRPRGEFDRLLALLLQPGRRGTPAVSIVLIGLQAPPRIRMDETAWRSATRAVGRSLAALGRERAYRLGDDQFALLLPRTETGEATALAADADDRARSALASIGVDSSDGVRPRVGWATAGDDATTPDELLRRADARPPEATPAR